MVEVPEGAELAEVDVQGARRMVNLGLLPDDGVEAGDWVLIHMGFALERMSEQQAREALQVLATLGPGAEDPLADGEAPPWA